MGLTPEVITAVVGGLTAIGAGLAGMVRWAVSVGREEADKTRTAHKDATVEIVQTQKARDDAERALQRERDAVAEARYQAAVAENIRNREAFLDGLDRVRAAYEAGSKNL